MGFIQSAYSFSPDKKEAKKKRKKRQNICDVRAVLYSCNVSFSDALPIRKLI